MLPQGLKQYLVLELEVDIQGRVAMTQLRARLTAAQLTTKLFAFPYIFEDTAS